MTRYSQNEEQSAITAACGPRGHFLDIGAWDALDLSNTRALYERGWSGVMIEPSPEPFDKLLRVYGTNPKIQLLRAAVMTKPGTVLMHVSPTPYSTTETANYGKWNEYVKHVLGDTEFVKEIEVPAVTVSWIFKEYGHFNFINIDTEGTSVDLLHAVLDQPVIPECICVEYDDRLDEALTAALARQYRCTYRSAENVVLVR